MKSFYTAMLTLTTVFLTACGGGGGGDSTPLQQNVPNTFDAVAGTYSTGCRVDQTSNTSFAGLSSKGVTTVTSVVNTQIANASLRFQEFSGTTCSNASLTFDITVGGDVSSLNQTKTYSAVAGGKAGTANVVQFKLSSITFSKGALADLGLPSLPAFGTTTKLAYIQETTKLYFASGPRGADGLGSRVSPLALTKQ